MRPALFVQALQQTALWEALLLALGLWWLRSRLKPDRVGKIFRRTLTLFTLLALLYALLTFMLPVFSISVTGALSLGARFLIILVIGYLSWEGIEVAVVYVSSRIAPKMKETSRVETMAAVVRWAGRSVILFVVGVMVLALFQIDVTPLVASASIVGLTIGLGSQKLVQDVVAGLFILIEDQFHVGDGVEVAGIAGSVEAMTLRVTKVRDFNGVLHIIPNSAITTVANKTREWARAIVTVGVGYESDLDKVMEVLTQVGKALYEENPEGTFLETPFPLGPEELADSAITFRLVARVKAGQQWAAQRLMRQHIKEAFDAEGIEIPFPQVDVHLEKKAS